MLYPQCVQGVPEEAAFARTIQQCKVDERVMNPGGFADYWKVANHVYVKLPMVPMFVNVVASMLEPLQ